MADNEQVSILTQGSKKWNAWRIAHPEVVPDLTDADLNDAHTDIDFPNLDDARRLGQFEPKTTPYNLRGAQMQGARLRSGFSCADFANANLTSAHLTGNGFHCATFSGACLRGARLVGAGFRMFTVRQEGSFVQTNDLTSIASINGVADVVKSAAVVKVDGADFSGADLSESDMRECRLNGSSFVRAKLAGADLRDADISDVDLSDVDLTNANLQSALLINTKVHRTKFNGALVFGISAWNLDFDHTEQSNLVVTPPNEPMITVDDLEVAQFVYLLMKNPRIRDVINTVGQKSVLILGRFGERKPVLDAIRGALRQHGLVPICFDFDRPGDRDLTETVMILAGMSRFIIADITSPRSVPLELEAIVPHFSIPLVPLIAENEEAFAMFSDLRKKHPWVLEPRMYPSVEKLVQKFDKAVIEPANTMLKELTKEKAAPLIVKSVDDY